MSEAPTEKRQRLDAIVGREGKDGDTYWTKLGVAFPTKIGHWEVRLDAMLAPVGEQRFRFLLVEPDKRKGDAAPEGEEIPF
jgi:hypothetical protein